MKYTNAASMILATAVLAPIALGILAPHDTVDAPKPYSTAQTVTVTGAGDTLDRDAVHAYAPCATEDAAGPCYWDAALHGNGIGQSFIVHADGTVTYL